MAQIKLGKRPKSFKKTVSFPMIDPETGEATTGKIEITYKYRTRSEFGEFLDKIAEAARKKGEQVAEEEKDKPFSMAKFYTSMAASNADYILECVDDWSLDGEEFNRANVQQLADEIPASTKAIMEDYRAAIAEGHLGN